MLSTSANLAGALVTIGGFAGMDTCKAVCAFSRNTQSWVELGSLPSRSVCAARAASLQDGKVMLIAGATRASHLFFYMDELFDTNLVWLMSLQSYSPNLQTE